MNEIYQSLDQAAHMNEPTVHNHSRSDATVFIVEDDPDVRKLVSMLVCSVGLNAKAFATPQEFLRNVSANQAGCAVLDMRMPGMTGLQLQREMSERGISLPVIFVTAHGEIEATTAAMRAGAVDYLTKPFSSQLLLDRINEAIAKDRKRRDIYEHHRQLEAKKQNLTARELEIMEHLVLGKSTKTIARQLGIAQKTVDNHRTKVLEKMQVDNTTQLAGTLLKYGSEEPVA